MAHIYEALRRSDPNADRGATVSTSERGDAPWRFDQAEPSRRVVSALTSVASEPAIEPRTAHPSPGHGGQPGLHERLNGRATERLVASSTAPPLLVEQFRSLAATLHAAQRERPLKSVIVTSPSPGDGKTHVAVNLALTLSESYCRRVLLIDADLRRPSLHRMFRLHNNGGLSEVLQTAPDVRVAPVEISATLMVLPAGRPEPNPLGALASDRMKRLVDDAVRSFDWVIVDAPPVGILADGRLVAENVDGAILVVRAAITRFADLQAAAETLGQERILGIVLNAVDPVEIRGRDYYQHYYGREHANAQ